MRTRSGSRAAWSFGAATALWFAAGGCSPTSTSADSGLDTSTTDREESPDAAPPLDTISVDDRADAVSADDHADVISVDVRTDVVSVDDRAEPFDVPRSDATTRDVIELRDAAPTFDAPVVDVSRDSAIPDAPRPPLDVPTTDVPPSPRETLAANELRFLQAIRASYVLPAADYSAASARRNDASDINNYYRAMCSLAMASLVVRRAAGETVATADREVAWLTAAANDFAAATDISPTNPWWWIEPTAGVDCLVAASLARDALPTAAHNTLVRSAAALAQGMVRDARFSVANYESLQATNRGNSQAEEVGVAASYLAAAYYLLPDALAGVYTAADRASWLTRAAALAAYVARDTGANSPFAPGQRLVANHQMSPHPVYTQSLLATYGEMAMVARQATPGLPLAAPATLSLPPADWADQVMSALSARTTADFGVTGAFDFVATDGRAAAAARYDDLRATVTNYPTGWQRLTPTQSVGAVSQILDVATGVTRSYQFRDGRVWNYTCAGGRCEAQFNHAMSEQWSSITNQAALGANPLPVDRLDAVSQFFDGDARLRTYLYRGDRIWSYDCTRTGTGPFACAAGYTNTLAAQFGAVGAQSNWGVPIPTSDLDAVSRYRDATTGGVRAYVYRGARVWHFRCEPTCTATYTRTLAELWAGVQNQSVYGAATLPADRVDAVSQFYDAAGRLVAYVYRDDRVWKYTCAAGVCAADFTASLDAAWAPVLHQERWATSVFSTRAAVVDWGFDASIQNSAYAWAAMRSAAHVAAYQRLQSAQLAQGRAAHPYLPARNASGAWSWGDFDRTRPGRMLAPLTDGWIPRGGDGLPVSTVDAMTLDEQVNAHWWINALDAFNHAVAYLLVTDRPLLRRFESLR